MDGSKTLVLGGTGPAGICLLRELLFRGHATVVYARNPAKVPSDLTRNPLLQVIKGEMTDRASLSSAISQCNIVVSVLGPAGLGKIEPSLYADYYSQNVFPLMREHSVRRILATTTVTFERPGDKFSLLRWFLVTLVWLIAHSAWHNVINIGKVFEADAQGLDWTVVRVAMIPGGSDEESWKADREDNDNYAGPVGEQGWCLSHKRGALARWLVDAVEGGADEWIGQMPAVSKLAGSKKKVT